jgi:hypothetical protein
MTAQISQLALRYARMALALSFLSPVADRFGLLGRFGGWGNFAAFTAYTAKVNAFMPPLPFLFLHGARQRENSSAASGSSPTLFFPPELRRPAPCLAFLRLHLPFCFCSSRLP